MSRIHYNKRRDFLKGAACMAASGAASTFVPQLSMMGTALAQSAPTGYKALVCIYLSGGNDSWNLLIPGDNTTNIPVVGRNPLSGFSPTPYGWYVTSRGGQFSGNASALGLVRPGSPDPGTAFLPPALGILGDQYGLNPAVPELQQLFNSGRLSFMANVGPLVEPLRRQGINSFRRPPQLYSHNDQTSLWQLGNGRAPGDPNGWGGRMAGRLLGTPPANGLAPCISISGQSKFLVGSYPSGQNLFPYRMSTSATSPSVTLGNYSGTANNSAGDRRRAALQELLDATYPQAFTGAYGDILDRSLGLASTVNSAIASLTSGTTYAAFNTAVNAIPNTGLGNQLRQVARMIAVSRLSGGSIQANRQVFYVSTGGYDTHGGQIPASRPTNGVWAGHQGLLQQVAQAMNGFNNALEALNGISGYAGVRNEVVTFTMSEFSRTINSNGNGTDHAWGALQMVMGAPASAGGPLQGGQIFGRYPLQLLNRTYPGAAPDVLGESFNRGEFLPTMAVEQMSATMARWMGVSEADLPLIFPNINTFASAHPNQAVMAYNSRTVPFLNI